MANVANQWVNAKPYFEALPSHVTGDDQDRLAAYKLYESIFWNEPATFKITQRGDDENPVYIPSAMKVIEATNRYLAKGFDYKIEGGSDGDRQAVSLAMKTLFRREKFYTKFNSMKRFGLVRGDALWHVIADDTKPAGKRISIHELDPSSYFPIYDPDDIEKITGCHLVSETKDEKGDTIIRRQTYRKEDTGKISSELATFKPTSWDDRNLIQSPQAPKIELIQQLTTKFELPAEITSLPVYHTTNDYQGGLIFGNSDLRGFERIIAAINQGVTDEELTLALDGLGVYFTNLPRPDGGWVMGPGSVVEGEEGHTFERVNGVGSVKPSQDHLMFLDRALKEGRGTPDISIGNVDVKVAESGISLALQMSPILARNAEREQGILATHDHLFYDLTQGWLLAYEGLSSGAQVTVEPIVGDPMPINRAAVIKEVSDLLSTAPPLISPEYARKLLAEKLGYEFPDEMGGDILTTVQNFTKATAYDPYEARVRDELDADLAEKNGSASGA
jgi:hypothetical protein